MYYIGMKSYDSLDVVETPIYNDEVKEILEYFYGDNYFLAFVIEGQDIFIKILYREPIKDLLNEWTEEINWKATNEDEYRTNLARLNELIK
ncbi:hypothetical protein NSQ20_12110 [Paenibacillus sp. FSL K6-1122]|uniref:hypothetical protein n=1 Tax=Paenibacillus sp. FSL K6-1122 TaxID=2954512 RepID=UPI0030EB60C5